MCAPAALAIAALGGSALSAYGQIASGNYNAAVGRQNAANLGSAAKDAEYRGDIAATNKQTEYGQIIGTQRARGAASGLDLSSGSPLDILTSTAGIGQQDIATIKANAAREAWGYRTEAASQLQQAKFSKRMGWFGAGTTLLTGGVQAAGMYASGAGSGGGAGGGGAVRQARGNRTQSGGY